MPGLRSEFPEMQQGPVAGSFFYRHERAFGLWKKELSDGVRAFDRIIEARRLPWELLTKQ